MSQTPTPAPAATRRPFWCSPDWHNGALTQADFVVRALAEIHGDIFEAPSWRDVGGSFAGPPAMFCVCGEHLAQAVEVMLSHWADVRIRSTVAR